MMIPQAWWRLVSVLSCVVLIAQLMMVRPVVVSSRARVQAESRKSKLLKHDRMRLIEALAQDKPSVTLLLAAKPGMNAALVTDVRKLNGVVQYRDDDVDYLRVEMATTRVQELAVAPAIESINLAGSIDYLSPSDDEQTQTQTAAVPAGARPPDRDTPAINPYLPTSAIGAAQFIASHPTFDGRGVVVAVVDTSIDLLLPELRTAKALDGTPVPKFADIYSATPNAIVAVDGDSNPSGYVRVAMETKVTASGGKVTHQNHSYLVPRDDQYRFGMLNERIAGPAGDLNRDGNPAGSSELFPVLWNETTNTVWVDTNQNFDFTDEKPMTDYRLKHDVGLFGRDDPKTAVRETVGFVIQTDAPHHAVFVIPGYGGHGTGVTGAAFGANFFGGEVNGVAPGTQLISIPPGRAAHITPGYIEAVITAMKDPRVDLVTMAFGNFLPLNDGHSTFSTIANRLVKKYGKLLFAGAGNGTDGLNGIISPADASEVVAVGSYISRETSRVSYGIELRDADNMNGYTSHGPTKTGGLKPNLLAPTSSLSTKVGFLPGENHYGTYPLPVGYQIYDGTSTSAPFAAAAAALLISAAKQSGVKYDPKRLRWALLSSARFLPKYSPELQGAGLLQVEAAWEALKNAPEPIEIESRAPVKAVLSEYLREPDQGTGIFEREGWTAGQSGKRTITLTRTSGKAAPMSFQLRWTGNDGTFTGPSEISLPLNTPVDATISIDPKTNGIHAAILKLVSANGAVVHQVMNTIVAADQLDSRNSFTITREGQVERLHSQSYFINVPAGTPALRVDVAIAQGNVMPSFTRPNGRFYYSLPPDQSSISFTRYQNAGTWSRVVSNPDPGVWQITVENCNTLETSAKHKTASFQVTAALLGVGISNPAPFYQSESKIVFSNTHSPFLGGVATTALASAFAANSTLKNSAPVTYEIDVPSGATRVGATLIANENSGADLDLYLFDCTGKQCVLRDFSTGNGSAEQVAVDSPAAGKWKAMIDPFSAPTTGSVYQYKDYFLHPAFGRVEPQSGEQHVAHKAVVEQALTLNLKAIPIGDRYLEAIVFVTSSIGRNTEPQERAGEHDLYYADKAILGAVTMPIKAVNISSTGK
jgi:hypothetical protein